MFNLTAKSIGVSRILFLTNTFSGKQLDRSPNSFKTILISHRFKENNRIVLKGEKFLVYFISRTAKDRINRGEFSFMYFMIFYRPFE